MRLALACLFSFVLAAAEAAPKAGATDATSLLPGGDSKAPISIEADHLDYFEKEGKAVYSGRVVVVQGETKLTCSKLTILMDKSPGAASPTPTPTAEAAASGSQGSAATSSVKHMDCAGPVTVVSKTQTATADNGSFDKSRNNVILIGHVVMSDGRNVTKGDRLVYDLTSGEATVQGGGSRVTGLFMPGADSSKDASAKKK